MEFLRTTRVSQVPRPICRRAPPPPTPESPTSTSARCFLAGAGFSCFGSLATLTERHQAESGVRVRYGSRLRHARLRPPGYPDTRSLHPSETDHPELQRIAPVTGIVDRLVNCSLPRRPDCERAAMVERPGAREPRKAERSHDPPFSFR
jgi:hypothetical protein